MQEKKFKLYFSTMERPIRIMYNPYLLKTLLNDIPQKNAFNYMNIDDICLFSKYHTSE